MVEDLRNRPLYLVKKALLVLYSDFEKRKGPKFGSEVIYFNDDAFPVQEHPHRSAENRFGDLYGWLPASGMVRNDDSLEDVRLESNGRVGCGKGLDHRMSRWSPHDDPRAE